METTDSEVITFGHRELEILNVLNDDDMIIINGIMDAAMQLQQHWDHIVNSDSNLYDYVIIEEFSLVSFIWKDADVIVSNYLKPLLLNDDEEIQFEMTYMFPADSVVNAAHIVTIDGAGKIRSYLYLSKLFCKSWFKNTNNLDFCILFLPTNEKGRRSCDKKKD